MESFKDWYLLREAEENKSIFSIGFSNEDLNLNGKLQEIIRDKKIETKEIENNSEIKQVIIKYIFICNIIATDFSDTDDIDAKKEFIETWEKYKEANKSFVNRVDTITRMFFGYNSNNKISSLKGKTHFSFKGGEVLESVMNEIEEEIINKQIKELKQQENKPEVGKDEEETGEENSEKIKNYKEEADKSEDTENSNSESQESSKPNISETYGLGVNYKELDQAIHLMAIGKFEDGRDHLINKVFKPVAEKAKARIDEYFEKAKVRNEDAERLAKEDLWENVNILLEKRYEKYKGNYEEHSSSFGAKRTSFGAAGLEDSSAAKEHYKEQFENLIKSYEAKIIKLGTNIANFGKSDAYTSKMKYKLRNLAYDFSNECYKICSDASKAIFKNGKLLNKIDNAKYNKAKENERKEEAWKNSEKGQAEAAHIENQTEKIKNKILEICNIREPKDREQLERKLLASFIMNNKGDYGALHAALVDDPGQPLYKKYLKNAGIYLPNTSGKAKSENTNAGAENTEINEGLVDFIQRKKVNLVGFRDSRNPVEAKALKAALMNVNIPDGCYYKDRDVARKIAVDLIQNGKPNVNEKNEDYLNAVEILKLNRQEGENNSSEENKEDSKTQDLKKEIINDLISNNIVKNIVNGTLTSVVTESEKRDDYIRSEVEKYILKKFKKQLNFKDDNEKNEFINSIYYNKKIRVAVAEAKKSTRAETKNGTLKTEVENAIEQFITDKFNSNGIEKAFNNRELIKKEASKLYSSNAEQNGLDFNTLFNELLRKVYKIKKLEESGSAENALKHQVENPSVTTAKCDGLPIGARKYSRAIRRRMNYALNKYL